MKMTELIRLLTELEGEFGDLDVAYEVTGDENTESYLVETVEYRRQTSITMARYEYFFIS